MSYNNASSNFHDLQFYDEDDEANAPTGIHDSENAIGHSLNVYRKEKVQGRKTIWAPLDQSR